MSRHRRVEIELLLPATRLLLVWLQYGGASVTLEQDIMSVVPIRSMVVPRRFPCPKSSHC